MWEFEDITKLALKELSSFEMCPFEKIQLEQQHDAPRQWAYPAYIDLCSRPNPPTVAEARRLGVERVALVGIARETLGKSGRGKPKLVRKVVCEVFGLVDPEET